MKSLLITSVFPPMTGGSGRWFWELYRRLPREEVVVVAGNHPNAASFDSSHNLELHRLQWHFPEYGAFSIAGLRRYRKLVRQVAQIAETGAAVAIHCGALLPDGWVGRQVARKLGLPYLVYLHGEELCYTESSRELNWMARRVLKSAQTVIVNSRNTERIALEHWRLSRENVRLLHPGVDTTRFAPAPPDPHVRERLGWHDRPVLLTVGRLQKRKGHDTLIRALPAIRRQIPNVLYAIVGDGPEREPLLNLVTELELQNHVLFHGDLGDDELVRCYQQCDLFVLPNRQIGSDIEGFGIVLLEAQACGKPVIAGTSGGTAEAMDAPRTGRLVNCDSPDHLAREIIQLFANVSARSRMGVEARQWTIQHFDWGHRADQLLDCVRPGISCVVALT